MPIHNPRFVLKLEYGTRRSTVKQATGGKQHYWVLYGAGSRNGKSHINVAFNAARQARGPDISGQPALLADSRLPRYSFHQGHRYSVCVDTYGRGNADRGGVWVNGSPCPEAGSSGGTSGGFGGFSGVSILGVYRSHYA